MRRGHAKEIVKIPPSRIEQAEKGTPAAGLNLGNTTQLGFSVKIEDVIPEASIAAVVRSDCPIVNVHRRISLLSLMRCKLLARSRATRTMTRNIYQKKLLECYGRHRSQCIPSRQSPSEKRVTLQVS